MHDHRMENPANASQNPGQPTSGGGEQPEVAIPSRRMTDPVCGMAVDPATAKFSTTHAEATYYFCSAGCQQKFLADPGHYLASASVADATTPAPTGARWTCPMHPQIVRDAPGACPICGMALEPMLPSIDDSHAQAEIAAVRRKLWISTALTLPVLMVAMGPHLLGWHVPAWTAWMEFVLGSIVVLWGGASFFQRFWTSLRIARRTCTP